MMSIKRALTFTTVGIVLACSGDDHPIAPAVHPAVRTSMNGASGTVGGPSIATDKDDYVPHEPVAMIGSGWQPGETVTLTLVEDPHICGDRTFTVTADSLGNFFFDEFAPEEHHAGVGFVLTAVGESSGLTAETRFTDSIAQGGSSSNTNGSGAQNPFRLMLSAPQVTAADVTAGAVLIAQVTVAKDIPSSEVICAPAGWTSILKTNYSGGTSKINQEIFYRVPTMSEPAQTHTWQFKTSSAHCGSNPSTGNPPARGAAGGVILYTGVDVNPATDAIRGFAGSGTGSSSSTIATAPNVNGAVAGDRVVRFFGAFKNTSFTPSAMPPRIYSIGSANNSTERTAAAFEAAQSMDGATDTLKAGIASSAEWLAQTVVLRMAAPACTAPSISAHPTSATKSVGESVTFSVTAAGTGLSYQWRKDGSPISGATSSSYTIASVTTGDGGSYDVVITGTCGNVTSNAATLTVNKRATMTSVSSSNNPSVFGQPVTFEATVSPTSGGGTPAGSVTFIEGGNCASPTTTHAGPLALSGGKAGFSTGGLSVGVHTITACYEDDATFSPSSGSVTQTVNKAQTSTLLNSSANPSVFSQSVTFTATVSAVAPGSGTPIGDVTFERGGTACGNGTTLLDTVALSNGQASFDTSGLGVSSHLIRACYPGSSSFEKSEVSIAQTVNKASTTTGMASSVNPSVFGQSVTFTATVSSVSPATATPVGDVVFKDGTCAAATVLSSLIPLDGSGQAQFTTSALDVSGSPHAVTACYGGNASFLESNGSVSQTVEKAYTTTSIPSITPSASQYVNGQVTVYFDVAVVAPGSGSPSGDVDVKNGTTVLCSAALPATSCSFTPAAVGALSLVASYQGDANFRSSDSPPAPYLVKYQFQGFFAPVDRPNTLNVSKAGQAVPLKWRLLDANNSPVSDLTAVNLKIGTLSCTTSSTDLIEEYASGSSGFQNQGDGYYQFNWKTPTSYANSCRTVGLDFGNGYLEYPLANFNFKK